MPDCGGVQYAKSHNIPTLTYPIPKKGDRPGLTKEELVDALKNHHKSDFVILAGYLKVFSVWACMVSCKRMIISILPCNL